MSNFVRHFAKNDAGATAIEYAMIASGIAIAIIAAVNALGVTLTGLFTDVEAGF